MQDTKKISNYCIECGLETKQILIAEKYAFTPQEVFSKGKNGLKKNSAWAPKGTVFKLLECSQCETPSLKTTVSYGTGRNQTCSFPSKPKIKLPDFIQDLQPKYYDLIFETYSAINHGNNILATMGIRCLIDTFLNEHISDIGGFDKKLNEALKAEIISTTQKDLLESIVEAGHASSHRAFKPDDELLLQSMFVVENLLENKISHLKLKQLSKKIPRRKPSSPPKKKTTKISN